MPSIIHSGNNNSPNIINQLLSAIQAAVYDIQMFYNNLMGGWSGTFTDGDGNTVTVTNGLVISVEAPPTSFKLTWNNIANALHTTVGDYNTLFGSDFTTLTVDGNDQLLTGNSTTFAMPLDGLLNNINIVAINDEVESVTSLGDNALGGCTSLTTVSFPACTSIGGSTLNGCTSLVTVSFPTCTTTLNTTFAVCTSLITVSLPACTLLGAGAFGACTLLANVSLPVCVMVEEGCFQGTALTTISLPACTSLGEAQFSGSNLLTNVNLPLCENLGGGTGNNDVFDGITGNTITLTIAASRQTCNGGNPDGDIVYLAANNTATINYV